MRFSERTNEIAAALAKAQGDFGPLVKGRENPHFKSRYADLAAVLDVIRAPLAENGLSFIQGEVLDEGGRPQRLVTRVMCGDQWIETDYPISVTDNRGGSAAQAVGSALTYARRYSLQALFGLAAEDDDGESAPRNDRPQQRQRREDEAPREPADPTKARAEKLAARIPGGWQSLDAYACAKLGEEKGLADLMRSLVPDIREKVVAALEDRTAKVGDGSWLAALREAAKGHERMLRTALGRLDFDAASKADDLPTHVQVGLALYLMGESKEG